jgi:hypothetical protein
MSELDIPAGAAAVESEAAAPGCAGTLSPLWTLPEAW